MLKRTHSVWIIDDDKSIRWVLERALDQAAIACAGFDNADSALQRLDSERPDAIISDIRMPGTDGLAFLEHVREHHPELPVIIMTAYADLDRAVASFKNGAFDYLPKPFDVDEVVTIVKRAVRHNATPETTSRSAATPDMAEIIGSAPAMQEVFRAIGRLSKSHMTVLLTGESGTGKELIARALHRHSPRTEQAFVAINTAAIPRELLESELFGHERGAFTGATHQRIGRFEQADGGVLFLDEIGDMPAELQTRLLRVLADGEFYRVGGHSPVKTNVRVIAATHQDLERRVAASTFREDLYHRLNVIRLHMPPLRERPTDLPTLVTHFLDAAAGELDTQTKHLADEAMAIMSGYHWPGNIRQLQNVCRWVTVMAPDREIHAGDLPPELVGTSVPDATSDWESSFKQWVEGCFARGESGLLQRAVPAFERIMIQAALNKTGGRRQDAARLLGWGRNTLTRKISELGLD